MAHGIRPLIRVARDLLAAMFGWRHFRGTIGAMFVLGVAWPLAAVEIVPERTLQFTVFSPNPIAGLVFRPRPDGPAKAIVFYPTARSPRYEYRGSNSLRFYQAPTPTPAQAGPKPASLPGATQRVPLWDNPGGDDDLVPNSSCVAEVDLPPGLQHAFLLFQLIPSAPGRSLRYHVQILDDSTNRGEARTVSIVNLSGLALHGKIGEREVSLPGGMTAPLFVGRATAIELRTPFKQRAFPAYVDTIELKPGERGLLILFPPFRPGSLEVQFRLLLDEPPSVPSPTRSK